MEHSCEVSERKVELSSKELTVEGQQGDGRTKR